jgi:hypothetical protein
VADSRILVANIPGQVDERVAVAVSGDPVLVDSVAQRVLTTEGIVTGALEAGGTEDRAYGHFAESGQFLPWDTGRTGR